MPEGSALWPESVAELVVEGDLESVSAFWLTASNDLLETRIRSSSRFDYVSPDEQALVNKFTARTARYNEMMTQSVRRLGLTLIKVEPGESTDDLMLRCLERLFE